MARLLARTVAAIALVLGVGSGCNKPVPSASLQCGRVFVVDEYDYLAAGGYGYVNAGAYGGDWWYWNDPAQSADEAWAGDGSGDAGAGVDGSASPGADGETSAGQDAWQRWEGSTRFEAVVPIPTAVDARGCYSCVLRCDVGSGNATSTTQRIVRGVSSTDGATACARALRAITAWAAQSKGHSPACVSYDTSTTLLPR